MASDRALYAVAVGVLALGLGNSLVNTQPDWLRSLADRSVSVAEQVSGRAEGYLGMAQVMFGRSESGFGRAQAALGRMQSRLGSMQAQLGRRQAEMARVQSEQVRMVTMQTVRRIKVTCPRTIEVNVSRLATRLGDQQTAMGPGFRKNHAQSRRPGESGRLRAGEEHGSWCQQRSDENHHDRGHAGLHCPGSVDHGSV